MVWRRTNRDIKFVAADAYTVDAAADIRRVDDDGAAAHDSDAGVEGRQTVRAHRHARQRQILAVVDLKNDNIL